MKIFGYKNVQMFFIPMFGAAVSGVSCNVAVWKKAIVILMGPLPGILISMVLMVIAVITGENVYFQAGSLFLFINAFNLLPIVPLDGGRFLQEVLFSRNRYFEMVMNILAALLFLAIGFATKSWIFKILGFMNLVSIKFRFRLASAAQQFQKELQAQKEYDADDSLKSAQEQDIPESILKRMLAWIHNTAPGPMKPKDIAVMVLDIWDRIRIHPPRWGATIALVGIFALGYFVAFLSMGVAAVGYYRNFSQKDEIVAYQDPNQATHYKQQHYFMGKLDKEIQLSDDKQYYHGFHKEYDFEKKLVLEGQWNLGRRTGSWKSYNSDSSMTKEVLYEENRQILTKSLKDEKWVEYRWEDYSDEEKEYYLEDVNEQYGPGNEYSQNFSHKNKIVAFEDPNRAMHYKQQRYFMGKLNEETQLSDDQKYYHGFYKSYYDDGVLAGQGQWIMGRRAGTWRYYDPNTSVCEEIVYEDNKPVFTKTLEDGQWIEYRWDKYSDKEKEYYKEMAVEQYGPGKEPDDDF
jgi:antitoxin component YwqK of YwqJK toxin-antitoxin module